MAKKILNENEAPCYRGERIRFHYEDEGFKQQSFAAYLEISTANLRRIETDPNTMIRSDTLIKMAKCFGVSTDYLLGLTPLENHNHEMQHLRLSPKACEKLVGGEINGDTLSRLMEHEKFGKLIQNTTAYLDDTNVEAIKIQNEVAAFGASLMRKYAHETQNPTHAHAAANGLDNRTVDAHAVQLEDLGFLYDTILKDTKAKVDQEKSAHQKIQRKPASAVTVARIAEIVDEARSQEQLTREEQIDYSADKIVEEIAEKTGLKGTSLKLLKPVFRFVFRNAGKYQDNE